MRSKKISRIIAIAFSVAIISSNLNVVNVQAAGNFNNVSAVVYGEGTNKVNKLSALNVTNNTIEIKWEGPKSSEGLEGYIVYKDGKELITLGSEVNSYKLEGLKSNSIYGIKIVCKFNGGEVSKPVSLNIRTKKDNYRKELFRKQKEIAKLLQSGINQENINKAIAIDGERLDLRHGKAYEHIARGQITEALKTYEDILALDNQNFEAAIASVCYYRVLGDVENATKMFELATEIDSIKAEQWAEKITRVENTLDIELKTEAYEVQADNHVIVTLGFALASNGTMQETLIKRLEQTLAMAEANPSAKIIVTGGVAKSGVTESYLMKNWLIENGIDKERIITEDRSDNTVTNAVFSANILKGLNPEHITLISSASHMRRAQSLFEEATLNVGINPSYDNLVYMDYNSMEEAMTVTKNELLGIYRDFLRTSGQWALPGMSRSSNIIEGKFEIQKEISRLLQSGVNLDTVNKILALDSERIDTMMGKAYEHIARGQITEALATYDQILEMDDENFEAAISSSIFNRVNGDLKQSEKMFKVAENIDSEKAKEWAEKIERVEETLDVELKTEAYEVQADNHAIVTLGFALASDGTMKETLIKRLEQTLAMAEANPNAKIIVSGGVAKSGVTESYLMKNWLIENGIEADRIITEDKSDNTVTNAVFSANILKKLNPEHITLISSASHMRRAQSLFEEATLNVGIKPTYDNLVYMDYNSMEEAMTVTKNELLGIYRDFLRTSGEWAYPGVMR